MKRLAHKLKKISRRWKLAGLGVLVLLILIAPSYYFYNKYRNLEMMLKNPQAARAAGVSEIRKKVGARIQLPTNETPELMTVSNKEKLASLPFFKMAENGDKVLLYKKAKMAYGTGPRGRYTDNCRKVTNLL